MKGGRGRWWPAKRFKLERVGVRVPVMCGFGFGFFWVWLKVFFFFFTVMIDTQVV